MLRAEAQTKKAENLLLFLSQINHDLQSSVLNAPGLTNLLITQGNINRIRQQLKKSSYDSYTLAISGTWEKLNGKILAQKASKKGGTPRTDVISLNPAN